MTTADRKSPPHRIAELSTDLERLRGELTRRERDAESLQREKSRLQRKNSRLQRENDRLKQQIEDLKQQLDEARRAGRRQAAPFAKDRPQGRGRRPGRRAGAEYGRHGCRPRPARVDETHAAPVPGECPDCGGAVEASMDGSKPAICGRLKTGHFRRPETGVEIYFTASSVGKVFAGALAASC